MTFEQAMATAKAGTPVKRSSWSGQNVTYDSTKGQFNVNITRTTGAPYTSNGSDMSATDWTTA